MPARNAIKTYVKNGYYHIYNRGVEKRTIFEDQQDYNVFLGYLGEYLQPRDEGALLKKLASPNITARERNKILKSFGIKNFNQNISVLAYALMPNHFHFFVKQKEASGIDKFMRSLCTRYVQYFNRKYKRVGSLFQGVYKAVLIDDEAYYVHISRYIHKQAVDSPLIDGDREQPSSYPEYAGKRKTEWVHPEEILELFSDSNPKLGYAQFVSEYIPEEQKETIFIDD